MTESIDLEATSLVAISRASLTALRGSLFRDLGGTAASYLQDAGYAGAGPIHHAFERWVKARGAESADALAVDDFGAALSEFFFASGWGRAEFTRDDDGVASLISSDWAEATAPDGQPSGCYFTTGVLADFFGRIADATISVMEVECRSMGSNRCKFLIGTPEKLQQIYEKMST
jgi:predicted hydrocarbon binding protein